jgi:hypothetical protein
MDRTGSDDFQCEEPSLGLFAVASGSTDGWVVSRTAIRALRQYIVETGEDADAPWPCAPVPALSYNGNRLRAAMTIASRSVAALRTSPLHLAAVLLANQFASVSILGRCQVYLARHGQLTGLYESLAPFAAAHEFAEPATCDLEWQPHDRWVICSERIRIGVSAVDIASVVFDEGAPASEVGSRLLDLTAAGDAAGASALVVTGYNLRTLRP